MSRAHTTTATMEVRPLPAQSHQDEDLQIVVSQMHQKFKGFRHITEQSLLDSITQNGADAMDVDVSSSVKAEHEKGTLEYIAANRATMMGQLDVALNDTMMLLDFTSLLAATYRQQPAEQTISAFLKTAMPIGSLAADNWVPTNDKKAQKIKDDEQQKITIGWKAESLSKAADSLLTAATRLRDTVEQETRYWAQMLDIQEQGWTVFRSPMARSQLGVQAASTEAGVYFKERGLLTLKAGDNGDLRLETQTKNRKMVQVQVRRNNKTISISSNLTDSASGSHKQGKTLPIYASLKHIRDSLFEEELFHEMNMEARSLLPFDVTVRQGKIQLKMPSQVNASGADEIVIELVSPHEAHTSIDLHEDDGSATYVHEALRLLLADYHQRRLARRTSKPPPMTLKARPEMTPRILTPLITALRHKSALENAEKSLQSLKQVLAKAQVPLELKQGSTTSDEPGVAQALKLRMSHYFELSTPSVKIQTGVTVAVRGSIRFEIVTQLTPGPDSPLGTSYFLTLPADLSTHLYERPLTKPKRFQLTDLRSAITSILDIMSKDLLLNVLAVEFGSWAQSSEPWLRSNQSIDGKSNERCIYVRLTADDLSYSCEHPVSLNLYESITGQAGLSQSTKWDMASASTSLIETVKNWITKAESTK